MKKQRFLLAIAALMLTGGCTRSIRPEAPVYKDASLDEILSLYQRQREVLPPLKGLMEVTIDDKAYKTFWAKWYSDPKRIEIEGFNMVGGTLFHFQRTDSHVSLDTKERNFHGSREEFKHYLTAHAPPEIKIEWLALFDWIARGGLPDLSLPDHPALEKQDNRFVLYLFKGQKPYAVLTQKILIEREAFRVTEASFFDSSGWKEAKMTFDDYRPFHQTSFPFLMKIEASGKKMEILFKELKWDENHTEESLSHEDSGD